MIVNGNEITIDEALAQIMNGLENTSNPPAFGIEFLPLDETGIIKIKYSMTFDEPEFNFIAIMDQDDAAILGEKMNILVEQVKAAGVADGN